MTVRFVRPISHSAYASRKIAVAALLLFVLATVGHRFGPLRTPDFVALMLLSAAIAGIAVPLALMGLMRLWQKGAEGGVASAQALLYAAVPIAVVGIGAFAYLTQPALYEVTTDIEDPPTFVAAADYDQEWLAGRAPVTVAGRRSQTAAYPGLTGRRYEGALDRVMEGVEAAALSARIVLLKQEGEEPELDEAEEEITVPVPQNVPVPLQRPGERPLPRDLASVEETVRPAEDLLVQGETRTLALGLPFDVVIRLREDEETTSVDIRVASRYGAHDLGMSAAIAEDFLDRLDTELLGIAGG